MKRIWVPILNYDYGVLKLNDKVKPQRYSRPQNFEIIDDIFDPRVPTKIIDGVYQQIKSSPTIHTFYICTKHEERMVKYLNKRKDKYTDLRIIYQFG